jgi:hypothetical protein
VVLFHEFHSLTDITTIGLEKLKKIEWLDLRNNKIQTKIELIGQIIDELSALEVISHKWQCFSLILEICLADRTRYRHWCVRVERFLSSVRGISSILYFEMKKDPMVKFNILLQSVDSFSRRQSMYEHFHGSDCSHWKYSTNASDSV